MIFRFKQTRIFDMTIEILGKKVLLNNADMSNDENNCRRDEYE